MSPRAQASWTATGSRATTSHTSRSSARPSISIDY